MRKKESEEYSTTKKIPESEAEYKFGDRLREQMKRHGYTQQKLADEMNVTLYTVRSWCQHYAIPSLPRLAELCRIFAPCSLDYFLGNIEEPNYDIKFFSEYTGLTPEAVQKLHETKNYREDEHAVLSAFIQTMEQNPQYDEVSGTTLLTRVYKYLIDCQALDLISGPHVAKLKGEKEKTIKGKDGKEMTITVSKPTEEDAPEYVVGDLWWEINKDKLLERYFLTQESNDLLKKMLSVFSDRFQLNSYGDDTIMVSKKEHYEKLQEQTKEKEGHN